MAPKPSKPVVPRPSTKAGRANMAQARTRAGMPMSRDYYVKQVNSIRAPHVYGYQPGGRPMTQAQITQYKQDVRAFNAKMKPLAPYLKKYRIGYNSTTHRYE